MAVLSTVSGVSTGNAYKDVLIRIRACYSYNRQIKCNRFNSWFRCRCDLGVYPTYYFSKFYWNCSHFIWSVNSFDRRIIEPKTCIAFQWNDKKPSSVGASKVFVIFLIEAGLIFNNATLRMVIPMVFQLWRITDNHNQFNHLMNSSMQEVYV